MLQPRLWQSEMGIAQCRPESCSAHLVGVEHLPEIRAVPQPPRIIPWKRFVCTLTSVFRANAVARAASGRRCAARRNAHHQLANISSGKTHLQQRRIIKSCFWNSSCSTDDRCLPPKGFRSECVQCFRVASSTQFVLQMRELWNTQCIEAGGSVELDAAVWVRVIPFATEKSLIIRIS